MVSDWSPTWAALILGPRSLITHHCHTSLSVSKAPAGRPFHHHLPFDSIIYKFHSAPKPNQPQLHQKLRETQIWPVPIGPTVAPREADTTCTNHTKCSTKGKDTTCKDWTKSHPWRQRHKVYQLEEEQPQSHRHHLYQLEEMTSAIQTPV